MSDQPKLGLFVDITAHVGAEKTPVEVVVFNDMCALAFVDPEGQSYSVQFTPETWASLKLEMMTELEKLASVKIGVDNAPYF